MPSNLSSTSTAEDESTVLYLCADYKEHIRPVIDLIDSLRDLGIDRDLPLPAIVVVGDQSAGKSSVLEMLSFVELPRGSGMVTRCPLEMRLKHSKEDWICMIFYDMPLSDDHKTASQSPPEIISHPNEVANKILTVQNLLAGDSGVSSSVIHLEITSPNVPDLTLIDLPGIIRIDDKEADRCNMITKMIEGYICREDTIILAIIPADTDLDASGALGMALTHDPNKLRTIGVVTKSDKIEPGNEEELVRIANNEKHPLKLGYTLVRCRSKNDSTNGVSLKDALTAEKTFFANHSEIQRFPQHSLGTENLAKRLNQVLVEHIKECLPKITAKTGEMIDRLNSQIELLGPELPESKLELQCWLFQMLSKVENVLNVVAEGLDTVKRRDKTIPVLNLYVKVKPAFQQYRQQVDKFIPAWNDEVFLASIRDTMKSVVGREIVPIVRYKTFEQIVQDILKKCQSPAKCLLDEVASEVGDTLKTVLLTTLGVSFIQESLQNLIDLQLKEMKKECQKHFDTFFKMEDLVYTGIACVPKDDGEENVLMLQKWILAYLSVSICRIKDAIPTAIIYYMIRSLVFNVCQEMWKIVVDENQKVLLLTEKPDVAKLRHELRQKLKRLTHGQEKLEIYQLKTRAWKML